MTFAVIDAWQNFFDDGTSLFDGKHRVFVGIIQDGDDNFIEQIDTSLNDVEVSVGQRVKRAWKNRASHKKGVQS
jgi:N-dimethylarginine dimethylaminohydrolase